MKLLDSLWPFRIVWVALPLAAGPGLVAALEDASTPIQMVAGALLWLAWGAGVVAMLVPRSVSLTVLRIVAPAALAAAVWAVVRESGALTVVGVGWCALAAALVLFVPAVADSCVDGSSYGAERRLCLRTPAALFLGPVELAWLAVVGGLAAGPLVLAAGIPVAGGLLIVVGVVAVPVGFRSLHQLSRRWVVFVPAGFVIHDPMTMLDPVLFPKRMVASIGPASAGQSPVDITAGALGLILELRLREPATVPLRTRGRRQGQTVETDRLLVAVARPGALIAESRRRGLPVSTGSDS